MMAQVRHQSLELLAQTAKPVNELNVDKGAISTFMETHPVWVNHSGHWLKPSSLSGQGGTMIDISPSEAKGATPSGTSRLDVARPILSGRDLRMEFNRFVAVDGVSIDIAEGSIHALIGPNGAGKTTCFNLLTKFLTPTGGAIHFDGSDITRLKPADVARRGLVRSFQISAVFDQLTALQNVRIALQRRDGDSFAFWQSENRLRRYNDEAMKLLGTVGLGSLAHAPAAELSYGRKRALELATTLAVDPKMLLLDEPMAGIAHEDIGRISDLIRVAAKGRTVLMVEHNLSVVASLADRITVLARGRVLAEGDYASISADTRVIEAYLGGGDKSHV
jgi:branched-chain amino acid transport system ATP-binding protein